MPYVTSIERRAMQKGRQEGRQEGIVEGLSVALEMKFGDDGRRLAPKLTGLDAVKLASFADGLKSAKTLDEVKRLLRNS